MIIKRLFICEKPSQAKSLAAAFDWRGGHKGNYIQNKDEVITWAIGHLLSQAPPQYYNPELKSWGLELLPIIPEKWTFLPPDKKNPKEKSKYELLQKIGDLLSQTEEVVIATDPDREGETIAWEMLDYFNYSGKSKRMIFGALDKKTLVDSLKNMVNAHDRYGLYQAGLGRMRADWLMGMNITMALTTSNKKYLSRGDVLSAGRVQSPTIHLVVSREKEIKNFKPVDHFTIESNFTNQDSKLYSGKLELNKSWCDDDGLLIDKVKAKQIVSDVNNSDGEITKYDVVLKETKPPTGYSLDEIEKEGINKFGYSAKKVDSLVQSLYENHKIVSYPRTDSGFMPQSQFKEAPAIINSIKANMKNETYNDVIALTNPKIKSDIWNDKKVSAHHAIIPIDNITNINNLSQDELNIYDLICKRYLMQFLGNYKYESTKITTEIGEYKFSTSGNVPKEQGWKIVSGGEKEKDEILPLMKKGDKVLSSDAKMVAKKTKPPAFYTEATLIADMVNIQKHIKNEKLKKIIKNGGIGTTATRGDHIENLFNKNYFKKDGKKVRATEKAFAIDSVLPNEIKLPETTAYWEEELNKIVSNESDLASFMVKQDKILKRIIEKIKNQECQLKEAVNSKNGKAQKCDKCGSMVDQIKSKKTGDKFWICANDECKSFYKDNKNKKGELIVKIDQPKQPDGDFTCFKCNKSQMLLRKSKNDNLFWVCSDDKCKTFAQDKNGSPVEENFETCQQCSKETLIRRKKKNSEEHFWVCSDKKCGVFANDNNGKPVFENKHSCFECSKETLVRRKKKNSEEHFWVCSDKKCGVFANDNNGKPEQNTNKPKQKQTSEHSCPNCKDGSLIKRKGSKGDFWGCNAYPKCSTSVPDDNGKPQK